MGRIRLVLALVRLVWDVWKTVKKAMVDAQEKRNEESVDKGVEEKDQRPIEKAIGSGNAGMPAKNREGIVVRPRKKRQ